MEPQQKKQCRHSAVIDLPFLGKEGAVPSLKVLTINGSRTSPDTPMENALSQMMRQEMATTYVNGLFPDAQFSTIETVNWAEHHSRHKGFFTSTAYEQLKQQVILYKDKFDVIIIWFADILRIGAKKEHTTSLLEDLSEYSDGKVSVICLDNAGRDLEGTAEATEEQLNTCYEIGEEISHVDGGKSLPCALPDLKKKIAGMRVDISNQAERLGELDDIITAGAKLGKDMPKMPNRLQKVLEKCVKKIEEGATHDNIKKQTKDLRLEMNYCQTNHGYGEGFEGVKNCAYLRTSDREMEEVDGEEMDESRKSYIDNLPVEQSSGVLAALRCSADVRNDIDASEMALLYDHHKARKTIKRDAFMKLLSGILLGKFKFIFMDTINRASGRHALNLLLISLCEEMGVEIILAKNVGQAKKLPADDSAPKWNVTAHDVSEADVNRYEALGKASKKCRGKIEALRITFNGCKLFKDMNEEKKLELSKALTELGSKICERAELRKMAERNKELWSIGDEDIIFDESSDEESEDEDIVLYDSSEAESYESSDSESGEV